jgi:hypothetical protein
MLFFPVGIGCLLLRTTLKAPIEQRSEAFHNWEGNLEHYALFEAVARQERRHFEALTDQGKLREIPHVRREADTLFVFPWIYAVFFLPTGAALSAEPGAYVAPTGKPQAGVHVAWTYADVIPEADLARLGIEGAFLSAGVAWQALFTVDGLLSTFLEELNYQQVAGRRSRFEQLASVRVVRAFCKQVADAARPLRWTVHGDALQILDQLAIAWTNQTLRESAEDKTELVALLYQQIEDEGTERRQRALNVFALILALGSMVSAVADLLTLFDPERNALPTPRGGILALAVPAFTGALAFLLLLWLRWRR